MMGEMKDSYKEKLGVQQQPMINMNITINRKRVFIHKLMHKIMSFYSVKCIICTIRNGINIHSFNS